MLEQAALQVVVELLLDELRESRSAPVALLAVVVDTGDAVELWQPCNLNRDLLLNRMQPHRHVFDPANEVVGEAGHLIHHFNRVETLHDLFPQHAEL